MPTFRQQESRSERQTTERKLIVAIPTRDRPAYLHWTVKSVLEQARDHGHKNVEVVVSDQSNPENTQTNIRLMEKLRRQFPGAKLHYYAPGEAKPIAELKAKATEKGRKAMEKLMPEDGHYGGHRNRLTLLALYHGGPAAAYLHLDDDSPIGKIEQVEYSIKGTTPSGRPTLLVRPKTLYKKTQADVLGRFMKAYSALRAKGGAGVSFASAGIPDAALSLGGRIPKPGELTWQEPEVARVDGHTMGPGRLLCAEAASFPYLPYLPHEDIFHAHEVMRAWKRKHRPTGYGQDHYNPIFPIKITSPEAANIDILHVGLHGPRAGTMPVSLDDPRAQEKAGQQYLRFVTANGRARRHATEWKKLARKIQRMGQKPGKLA